MFKSNCMCIKSKDFFKAKEPHVNFNLICLEIFDNDKTVLSLGLPFISKIKFEVVSWYFYIYRAGKCLFLYLRIFNKWKWTLLKYKPTLTYPNDLTLPNIPVEF
jgi:hypothetical protein